MDLSQLTDQQLEQEIERRKKAQLEQAEPEPLDCPGWLAEFQLCKRYVHSVWAEGYAWNIKRVHSVTTLPAGNRHYWCATILYTAKDV